MEGKGTSALFSGIVAEIGKVTALEDHFPGKSLRVYAPQIAPKLAIGGSVAVNGCCLTVTKLSEAQLSVDLTPETLQRTALGSVQVGEAVNLEPPLTLATPLDGHLVLGHVDGLGRIEEVRDGAEGRWLIVALSAELAPFVAPKGSIAVDGVSLTVVAAEEAWFSVTVIPHTAAVTTLGRKQPGDRVAIEVDVLARYLARLMQTGTVRGKGVGQP